LSSLEFIAVIDYKSFVELVGVKVEPFQTICVLSHLLIMRLKLQEESLLQEILPLLHHLCSLSVYKHFEDERLNKEIVPNLHSAHSMLVQISVKAFDFNMGNSVNELYKLDSRSKTWVLQPLAKHNLWSEFATSEESNDSVASEDSIPVCGQGEWSWVQTGQVGIAQLWPAANLGEIVVRQSLRKPLNE
jgi:hypothetical protein